MLSTCDSCHAEFDVTGKNPGAVFKCPRCGDGRIRVPQAEVTAAGIEAPASLDTSSNVPPEAETSVDQETSGVNGAKAPTRRTGRIDTNRRAPRKRSSSRAESKQSRRSTARKQAPSRDGLPPVAIGAIALTVIAVAVGGLFMMKRDGNEPTNKAAVPAKSVREIYEGRRAGLSASDARGRASLAVFCTKKGMKTEARNLHREALLIEPNMKPSRLALDFTLYTGRAQQYKGRWLEKDDLAEAIAAERFVTGDELDGSSTPTDIFMANANAIKQQMLSEFPEDRWLYAFGPGVMQMPFMVLIERRGKEDDYRIEYEETLTALKTAFYQKYQAQFGLQEITIPIRAVIFESTQTYNTHRANHPDLGYSEPDNILGYYMTTQQQLVMWRKSQGGDWKEVLFHEGTHVFVHYAFSGADFEQTTQTPWFQEGFAEYFGGYKVVETGVGRDKKKTYKLGYLLPDRMDQYDGLEIAGALLSLKQMVEMSTADFLRARGNRGDPSARALIANVYAQGWVMVMYLHYAHGGKYKSAFDAYFEAETNGAGYASTFAELMNLNTPADWQNLEDDLREWAAKDLPKINKSR